MAIYIDGLMEVSARERFEAHVADCDRCRELLAEVVRTPVDAGAGGTIVPFRRTKLARALWAGGGLLAAAASIVLVLRVQESAIPELQQLVQAVGPRRPFDARLTGGFAFGPLTAPTRSGAHSDLPAEVGLAVARIRTRAAHDPSAAAQRALGLAYLLSLDLDRAVGVLEEATRRYPDDANLRSDLSAAYLARGARQGRSDDWPRALDSAERALAIDRSAPPREARFNRAVALEALGRTADARRAWQEYLQVDPTGPWADEARRRLERLGTASTRDPARPGRALN